MRKNKVISVVLFILILASCKEKNESCTPDYFQNYLTENGHSKLPVLKLTPVQKGDSCFYNYEMSDLPIELKVEGKFEYDQSGELFLHENRIYVREKYLSQERAKYPYVLWDFNLKPGDTVTYKYDAKREFHDESFPREYTVTLDKIIKNSDEDIYKFRFIKYKNTLSYVWDVVYFVGINSGLTGMYYSDVYSDSLHQEKENIIDKIGNIYDTDTSGAFLPGSIM